jgi:hypothetical protein
MCGPLARRTHTRTLACLLPPLLRPSARESEISSGAARLRSMTASSAASPMQPNDPHTTPLSTAAVKAPEDVEHPVGRRREAHQVARGGAGA